MKTITVHQPWASLIAFGLKTIETRGDDRFRGLVGRTIAIHASQTFQLGTVVRIRADYGLPTEELVKVNRHAKAHLGCIVAVAHVVAHRLLTGADSRAALCPANGLFGLILDNVRRFREPIPATGHRRIWTWEPPGNWRELVT